MNTGEDRDDKEKRQQVEREKDLLVQLLARGVSAELDPADPANARFFDWLATTARGEQRGWERRRTALLGQRFADRMLPRALAAAAAIRLVEGPPTAETQHASVSLVTSIDLAARRGMAPMVEPAVAAGTGRELWDEPSDRWVSVPDELPGGRYVAMPVAGDSMVPLLHAGDTILVRLGSECERGDVIVARHGDDGYVVKRVGRLGRDAVQLTSLNSTFEPLVVPRAQLNVIGVLVLRWCTHSAHDVHTLATRHRNDPDADSGPSAA